MLVDAAVSDTWRPSSVYRMRLSIEDAELLVKLLSYLARELDEVAAVQFAIGPVEPAQEWDMGPCMTESQLN